ncbi:MAG: 5-formyltetrahydrofolate cyclo-ligase [Prevotella sp.]|nr:5-formyltetrahydrofolate cyclo-ligase [Prevotella sp.]
MNKEELRKYIFEQTKGHSTQELEDASRTICEKLMEHEKIKKAETIVLFWSMKNEVKTHDLIPRLVRDKNVIIITQSADTKPVVPPSDAVIIVPGIAFDNRGYRLGRGKGYYDRYLSKLEENYKIGICFPWQMIEKVPTDSHDVCVNEVIC